jgi:hypothetical protein
MNDQQVIKNFLDKIDKGQKIYVDIGSSYESNLPKEIIKDGNKTLFFEIDSIKASAWKNDHNFEIINQKVTPNNVYDLIFEKISKDSEITFIDIDIDGYDFHVLNNLLQKTRPFLITAEINEKIPPPIKFSVKYNDNYFWDSSHFYGMSISKFDELAKTYEYDLIELTANNVYAIRKDKNTGFQTFSSESLYNEKYKNPRLKGLLPEFNYNNNFDNILKMNKNDAIKYINSFFINYIDQYELY